VRQKNDDGADGPEGHDEDGEAATVNLDQSAFDAGRSFFGHGIGLKKSFSKS
jgi:hypothetical protein